MTLALFLQYVCLRGYSPPRRRNARQARQDGGDQGGLRDVRPVRRLRCRRSIAHVRHQRRQARAVRQGGRRHTLRRPRAERRRLLRQVRRAPRPRRNLRAPVISLHFIMVGWRSMCMPMYAWFVVTLKPILAYQGLTYQPVSSPEAMPSSIEVLVTSLYIHLPSVIALSSQVIRYSMGGL
jgi:hypothetical protein